MADITAAAVKALREKTKLPMMECKKALTEAKGIEADAIKWLQERIKDLTVKRADRETAFGRFGLYIGLDKTTGAMVELLCESAPVTTNEDFIQLSNDLAEQLATGPGASTADELLAQKSPSCDTTLGEQKDTLFNQIREVFKVGRMVRCDGPTGGYMHSGGVTTGVLLQLEGGNEEAAKDVAMHVAAMKPAVLDETKLDAAEVDAQRGELRQAAIDSGKPPQIVDKIVDGQMKNFFAGKDVLMYQPFVKDDKQTVGDYAAFNGMKVKDYWNWIIGEKVS